MNLRFYIEFVKHGGQDKHQRRLGFEIWMMERVESV